MSLKKITQDVNLNIYLQAAKELGYEVEVIEDEFGYAIIKKEGKRLELVQNALSVNNQTNSRIASSKYLTSTLLRNKLRELVPNSIIINLDKRNGKEKAKIEKFFNNHPDGIVVKPNNGSLAKGVLIKPKNIEEVFEHIEILDKKISLVRYVMIEEFSPAKKEFRFLTYKGKIIDVIKRLPAYIIGSGKDTLEELINKKNEIKRKDLLPTISIDSRYLANQNIDLDSVPLEGRKIKLNQVCNMGMGGEVVSFDIERLHKNYHKIAKLMYETTKINLIGADIMSDDLSEDPYTNKTIINEINSAPMPELSYFSRIGSNVDPLVTVKELLSEIFTQGY